MRKLNLKIKLSTLHVRLTRFFVFSFLILLGTSHISSAKIQQKDLSQPSKEGWVVRVPKDTGAAVTVVTLKKAVDNNGEEYFAPDKKFWVKPGEEKDVPEDTAVCAYNSLSMGQVIKNGKVKAEVVGPKAEALIWKLNKEQQETVSYRHETQTYIEVFKERNQKGEVYFQRKTTDKSEKLIGYGKAITVREGRKAGAAGACDELFSVSSLEFSDALAAQVQAAAAREEVAEIVEPDPGPPPLPGPTPGDIPDDKKCASSGDPSCT